MRQHGETGSGPASGGVASEKPSDRPMSEKGRGGVGASPGSGALMGSPLSTPLSLTQSQQSHGGPLASSPVPA